MKNSDPLTDPVPSATADTREFRLGVEQGLTRLRQVTRPDGGIQSGGGTPSATPPEAMPPHDTSVRPPGQPSWRIDVVASTGSTNTDAVAQARSGDRGVYSALIALEQVAGKGRLDRQWEAPAGSSLFMSMVAPMVSDAAYWGLMPLVAGLAVRRGLTTLIPGTADAATTHVSLKWPNDVLVRGVDVAEPKKVCGILLETVRDLTVIGVGVNVSQSADQIGFPAATSLALCGLRVSRVQVATVVLDQLGRLWPLLATSSGRDQVRADYTRSCDTVGRRVRVWLDEATSVEGEACGIADDGELLVDVAGTVRRFASGDVYHLR